MKLHSFNRRTQWRIQDFPLGGANLLVRWGEGGADLRHECFSVETYVKMKEPVPVGDGSCLVHGGGAPPPGSTNETDASGYKGATHKSFKPCKIITRYLKAV